MQSLDRHSGLLRVLGKPLPVINGQLQPWRAASGLFFCNEFCADDAEEASFQSRGSTGAEARNSFGLTRAR
jgi:hypothetical protein